jgi:hypothetical protein
VNRVLAALLLLLALGACRKRDPPLPRTPFPKAKLAYRLGNCVYMDLTHSGGPEKGRCFGFPGQPMVAHDFDGNGTADLAVVSEGQLLIDTANDGQGHEAAIPLGEFAPGDQLIPGDYSGTATHRAPALVAVRRGSRLHLQGPAGAAGERTFGDGSGEYFSGRWGKDAPARFGVRHGACVDLDQDGDDRPDRHLCYPEAGAVDQVLVGDWNGDGADDLILRRGACVWVDMNLDGSSDARQCFGADKPATDYFAGSWDGK